MTQNVTGKPSEFYVLADGFRILSTIGNAGVLGCAALVFAATPSVFTAVTATVCMAIATSNALTAIILKKEILERLDGSTEESPPVTKDTLKTKLLKIFTHSAVQIAFGSSMLLTAAGVLLNPLSGLPAVGATILGIWGLGITSAYSIVYGLKFAYPKIKVTVLNKQAVVEPPRQKPFSGKKLSLVAKDRLGKGSQPAQRPPAPNKDKTPGPEQK